MDETMNDITWINSTATTSDDITMSMYFPEPIWEPYIVEKYVPKWHIQEGYKNQINHMWD